MYPNDSLKSACFFVLLMAIHLSGYTFGKRVLLVTCPAPIYPNDYSYELYATYEPVLGAYASYYYPVNNYFVADRRTVEYEIRGNYYGNFPDTLVRIGCEIKHNEKYGTYLHLDTVISVNADTVRFVIPPIDNASEIIAYLAEEDRKYQEAHKGEAFRSFVNYWESRFLYVSYYQGNRPFAEVLFGPARYLEMPEQVFKGPDVPAIILGPQAGTEINFNWDPDKLILGPKLGVAVCNRTIAMGLHFIYYTDFDRGQLFLTPRIGFSPWSPFVNFAYAYSMRLGKDKFGGAINRHQFCLIFNIPLKRVKYY
jgi:hypothetical protein